MGMPTLTDPHLSLVRTLSRRAPRGGQECLVPGPARRRLRRGALHRARGRRRSAAPRPDWEPVRCGRGHRGAPRGRSGRLAGATVVYTGRQLPGAARRTAMAVRPDGTGHVWPGRLYLLPD